MDSTLSSSSSSTTMRATAMGKMALAMLLISCGVQAFTLTAPADQQHQAMALRLTRSSSPSSSWRATRSSTRPLAASSSSDFIVGILGDLHMDPRKMQDYHQGRQHFRTIFHQARQEQEQQDGSNQNIALVSLGDLGESKSVRPDETNELFAGTTECHQMAADYLQSFGVPYELVGGNHDLEGVDEFLTDEANLDAFLRIHKKPAPQFVRQIADKTLLVGLTSTVFRGAKYTSHEVTIDDPQLRWFERLLEQHPAEDQWKIFVMTHAPPLGSGLRVLQENHVVNGCCWLNHSNARQSQKFIRLVREHKCIKAWFSGHFHLGQDYQDSISLPTDGGDRGSCVFVQTSVMRQGTSRDGCRQSRLLRGNDQGFDICTVDHDNGGQVRVDASIQYVDDERSHVVFYRHDEQHHAVPGVNGSNYKTSKRFKVYAPRNGDPNMVHYDAKGEIHLAEPITKATQSWWHMSCGRVLGIQNGMLIEYEPSTMAPLGLVVGADELIGKRVAVIDSCSEDDCIISLDAGLECPYCGHQDWIDHNGDDHHHGLKCSHCGHVHDTSREQALLLLDKDENVVVVQPNEDGSYWRKIVRNKIHRMREKQRERAARAFAKSAESEQVVTRTAVPAVHNPKEQEQKPQETQYVDDGVLVDYDDISVISSWGPYISTVGMANETGYYSQRDYEMTPANDEEQELKVVSSWGPYKSTSGIANETGVFGLTMAALV